MKSKPKGKRRTQWPWIRHRTPASISQYPYRAPEEWDRSLDYNFKRHNFDSRCAENEYPDIDTKIASIQASASVVCLITYTDDKKIFQGTGTIINEDGTILTSAKLVRCPTRKNVVADNLKVIVHMWDGKSYEAQFLALDFYYGIAVVKIQENGAQLKPACLRLVDDCASLESKFPIYDYKGFQLRPHSNAYNLVPGDKVIALGRKFIKPFNLMAAPGQFSIERCSKYNECKELFRATCLITETGNGGPLINCHGEVIGVASFDFKSTPFLPINVALKWWEHYKKFGKLSRPLLGMKLANLYALDLHIIEKVIQKFTNNFVGVSVEKVIKGSSADIVGMCPNDLIVRCCGKPVRSFLDLFDMIWDNIGNSVEFSVIRAMDYTPFDLTMNVVDATEITSTNDLTMNVVDATSANDLTMKIVDAKENEACELFSN